MNIIYVVGIFVGGRGRASGGPIEEGAHLTAAQILIYTT